MKANQFSILTLCFFCIVLSSCSNTDFDKELAKWKTNNESYFTNMKDSTAYTLFTIPSSSGGGSYYYKITTPGIENSISPVLGDQVVVNYRGQLVNGYVFDQTFTRAVIDSTATPRTFYDNQLITGWTDNLIRMKVGETRSIVLPQNLGYGAQGSGPISPYSTTVWVVQLIKVIH